MFRRFGTEVTVVGLDDTSCRAEDAEVSQTLKKALEDEGMQVPSRRHDQQYREDARRGWR